MLLTLNYGTEKIIREKHDWYIVIYDHCTSEKNNYTSKPPTFSWDCTEFEWLKSKMYTHIIGVDVELWNILEDCIEILVDGVGMVADRKSLTHAQKKTYIKH